MTPSRANLKYSVLFKNLRNKYSSCDSIPLKPTLFYSDRLVRQTLAPQRSAVLIILPEQSPREHKSAKILQHHKIQIVKYVVWKNPRTTLQNPSDSSPKENVFSYRRERQRRRIVVSGRIKNYNSYLALYLHCLVKKRGRAPEEGILGSYGLYKYSTYMQYIPRVPSSELDPPAQASVAPPWTQKGGGSNILLRVKECRGTQIRRLDSRLKAWYSEYSVIEVLRRMCDSGASFLCVCNIPTNKWINMNKDTRMYKGIPVLST